MSCVIQCYKWVKLIQIFKMVMSCSTKYYYNQLYLCVCMSIFVCIYVCVCVSIFVSMGARCSFVVKCLLIPTSAP